MKKIINLILLNLLTALFCFGQIQQKTTLLNVIENLAENLNLELSYSPDLVFLTDSTNFIFSANPDTCIAQLEKQAEINVVKTDTHLIITSTVPPYIQLHGKVTDAKTGELLPYTNILIEKAGTGTITNTEGEFDFKVLGRLSGSEVTFSFLGYKHQKLVIPKANKNNLVIKMQPKPYTLSDIYVLPSGTEAVDIVKRAVKNIKRNYARTTTQMEAFYRRTDYRDTVASQLTEAALLIEDKGITKSTETTRIQIEEIRKSTNYLVPENQKEKLFGEALEKMWGHRNIFYRTYANDVRSYRSDWWYQPLTQHYKFKYEFAGFEWLDSVKVYKIKFIYDALELDGKRASENPNAESAGYIYINAQDWAILKIESWWKVLNHDKLPNLALKGDYWSWGEIGYQKINGKYYFKYKRDLGAPNGKFSVYENEDSPEKHKKVKSKQYSETTLLVTKVITNKKEMDKIRYREKLARDENSLKTNYPYHPEFWKNYNVLKENPVEEKFIKEMEWKKSLDIQFEENSSNHAKN